MCLVQFTYYSMEFKTRNKLLLSIVCKKNSVDVVLGQFRIIHEVMKHKRESVFEEWVKVKAPLNLQRTPCKVIDLSPYLRIFAIFTWLVLKSANFMLLIPHIMEFIIPIESVFFDNFMVCCNKSYEVQLLECWDSIFETLWYKKQPYILINEIIWFENWCRWILNW